MPFCHSAILPLCHSAILPFCHSAILPPQFHEAEKETDSGSLHGGGEAEEVLVEGEHGHLLHARVPEQRGAGLGVQLPHPNLVAVRPHDELPPVDGGVAEKHVLHATLQVQPHLAQVGVGLHVVQRQVVLGSRHGQHARALVEHVRLAVPETEREREREASERAVSERM